MTNNQITVIKEINGIDTDTLFVFWRLIIGY